LLGVGLEEPTPPAGVIANRIREQIGGDGEGVVDQYAAIVARLHSGPPKVEPDVPPEASDATAAEAAE
jgi:hypothetical protein